MASGLLQALDTLSIAEPLFVRNLSVYPLTDCGGSGQGILTFEEGLNKGSVAVSELEVPSVTEVILDNSDDEPLFLLDGEEIFGAQQTRVTTTAALVDARSSVRLPVACIEEGRWEGSRRFTGSFSSTHPRLRSIICGGVTSSLGSGRSFHAPQRLVWDEITRELNSLSVSSATASFHDLAFSLASETERYLVAPETLSNAQGMIVSSGKDFLGLEYFRDLNLFERLSPRMLRGYALSGLERRSSSRPLQPEDFKKLLSRITAMKPSLYPGVSLGEEMRFGDERLVGRALVLDGTVFQASFFPRVN